MGENFSVVERAEGFLRNVPFDLAVCLPATKPMFPIKQIQHADAATPLNFQSAHQPFVHDTADLHTSSPAVLETGKAFYRHRSRRITVVIEKASADLTAIALHAQLLFRIAPVKARADVAPVRMRERRVRVIGRRERGVRFLIDANYVNLE